MNQRLAVKAIVAVLLAFGLSAPVQAANERSLSLTTGDAASGLMPVTGEIGQKITRPEPASGERCRHLPACHEPRLSVSVQTSASVYAALAKLRSGAVDMAVLPDMLAYAAFTGSDARRLAAMPNLRALASVQQQTLYILVKAGLPAVSVARLAGLRLAVGPRASDYSLVLTSLLAGMGLPEGQYTEAYADRTASAAELIGAGLADAALVLADGLGAADRAALRAGELRLLSPGKSELEKVARAYPFVSRITEDLEGQNYTGIRTGNLLVIRAGASGPLVRSLLTRLWLTPSQILNKAEAVKNLPFPLHSEAQRFYQEVSPPETSP